MIRSKIVLEKMIVYGGTHKNDSNFGIKSDYSFDGQQYEICVDVPFMNLVKDYERIFIKKLSAMN